MNRSILYLCLPILLAIVSGAFFFKSASLVAQPLSFTEAPDDLLPDELQNSVVYKTRLIAREDAEVPLDVWGYVHEDGSHSTVLRQTFTQEELPVAFRISVDADEGTYTSKASDPDEIAEIIRQAKQRKDIKRERIILDRPQEDTAQVIPVPSTSAWNLWDSVANFFLPPANAGGPYEAIGTAFTYVTDQSLFPPPYAIVVAIVAITKATLRWSDNPMQGIWPVEAECDNAWGGNAGNWTKVLCTQGAPIVVNNTVLGIISSRFSNSNLWNPQQNTVIQWQEVHMAGGVGGTVLLDAGKNIAGENFNMFDTQFFLGSF